MVILIFKLYTKNKACVQMEPWENFRGLGWGKVVCEVRVSSSFFLVLSQLADWYEQMLWILLGIGVQYFEGVLKAVSVHPQWAFFIMVLPPLLSFFIILCYYHSFTLKHCLSLSIQAKQKSWKLDETFCLMHPFKTFLYFQICIYG